MCIYIYGIISILKVKWSDSFTIKMIQSDPPVFKHGNSSCSRGTSCGLFCFETSSGPNLWRWWVGIFRLCQGRKKYRDRSRCPKHSKTFFWISAIMFLGQTWRAKQCSRLIKSKSVLKMEVSNLWAPPNHHHLSIETHGFSPVRHGVLHWCCPTLQHVVSTKMQAMEAMEAMVLALVTPKWQDMDKWWLFRVWFVE